MLGMAIYIGIICWGYLHFLSVLNWQSKLPESFEVQQQVQGYSCIQNKRLDCNLLHIIKTNNFQHYQWSCKFQTFLSLAFRKHYDSLPLTHGNLGSVVPKVRVKMDKVAQSNTTRKGNKSFDIKGQWADRTKSFVRSQSKSNHNHIKQICKEVHQSTSWLS